MAQGKSNAAIAATLVLSTRAVEKHTNSIFSKLGLTEEADVNRRVKAVLLYLADGRRRGRVATPSGTPGRHPGRRAATRTMMGRDDGYLTRWSPC